MAFTILDGGSFTSTGAGVKINLPSSADYFQTWNITQLTATNPNTVVKGEWFGSKFGAGASAANDGLRWVKTSTLLTVEPFSNSTASDGFTYVTSSPVVEAQNANAITAITAANPAVVSQTNTYAEDDILRIYNTTGMLQYGGMLVQISTVSSSAYTLIGIQASGLAAGTAGNTRRVSKYAAMEPEFLYVTEITQASSAVVRTSVDPSNYYVVGMKLSFNVPSSYGMTEISGLTGTITAISAANYTMTVDINSSAFTAFAFPLTTESPTAALFASVAPAGAKTSFDPVTGVYTGYNFGIQPFHTGQFTPYMFLAGGAQSPAGASSDVINWMSYKLET
jgi:hypothetical protein